VLRSIVALVLLLSLALVAPAASSSSVAACAASPVATPVSTPASAFLLTVTDDLGRQVTIPALPQRIVSLAPSNTEILFALGLDDRVAAVDAWSDYPPEAQEKPEVGDYVNPDLEQIVAIEPDLVLATAVHEATVLPQLEDLQIPTVVLEPTTLDEILADIELVGEAAGVGDTATALVCAFENRVDVVESAVAGAPAPRIFFELSPDLFTAGEGSFVDDLITRAGGDNIVAGELGPWPQISAEALIAADPEVILLADHEAGVTPELVRARPGWQEVSAVREDRIVTLDSDLFARPGPRLVDGLEEIARALHPDRFP
jgi:iron complex transport system substrate-binding protein